MKSKKPYLIKDPKNKAAYFGLLYGIKFNQIEAVKEALDQKVEVNQVWIDEESYAYEISDAREMNNFRLIPLVSFVQLHSSAAICKLIMESYSLTDEDKGLLVIKALSKVKKDDNITKNQNLQETIKKYVNDQTINRHYNIYSYKKPFEQDWRSKKIFQATFLHVAAATKNRDLVEQLISLGANVNALTKNAKKETPAFALLEEMPDKGDQSHYLKTFMCFLKHQAKLEITNSEGDSGWSLAIDRFKIPELTQIFEKYRPTDLASIESLAKKSQRLYQRWMTKTQGQGFNQYPLINDIYKHEKLSVKLSGAAVTKSDAFLKNTSLKQALQKRYKTSAPRLCKAVNDYCFSRSDRQVLVDLEYLSCVDVAYDLFVKGRVNPNWSDFLTVIEKNTRVLGQLTREIKCREISISQVKNFLNKFYRTDAALRDVLILEKVEDKDGWADFYESVRDSMQMYNNFQKELDTIFARTKFSTYDNLAKLHDFINGEVEALEQENFPLHQEVVNPQLKNLSQVKMSLGYGVKLAEENHDLIRWGAQMGHCVGGGSYAREAKNGETIILAITKDQDPKYCIEIRPSGEIEQVQGVSHSVPEKKVMDEFVAQLKKVKILNRNQKASDWYKN